MKKTKFWSILLMMLVGVLPLVVTSCGDDDDDEITVEFNPVSLNLGSKEGARGSFVIKTEGDWTITNVPSFLSVSANHGRGTTTIDVYTIAENRTSNKLTEDIVFSIKGIKDEQYFPVSQEAGLPTNCTVRPLNALRMCDAFCFEWEIGENVKYFYWSAFRLDTYKRMTQDEVINEVVTGELDDRVLPDNIETSTLYNLYYNTEYVIVSIGFDSEGKMGEIVSTNMKTKDFEVEPVANISSISYVTYDEDIYYQWEIEKNKYCYEYYSYVCVSKYYFSTLLWALDEADAAIAWHLREEINQNSERHQTNINKLENGREMLFAPQINNGIGAFEANLYSDIYFQVITWGTNGKGELSGILESVEIDLSANSESNANKLSLQWEGLKTNKKYSDKSSVKKVNYNKGYLDIIRLN